MVTITPPNQPANQRRLCRVDERLSFLLLAVWLVGAQADAATVRIRMYDADERKPAPAMVCITGQDGEVRLPPDGRVSGKPSMTQDFYKGIHLNLNRNWIGPVRKMQGKGDNNDRSYVYELMPSIPYWHEPVMYQTTGDFDIQLPDGEWRISVDHGMEYIPVTKTFRVDGETDIDIRIELRRWIDMPKRGWWSGDVHVHHPTVDKGHRDFLLEYAKATDLHVVNILEMGHHEGCEFIQEGFGPAFRVRDRDYCLVSGQEDPRSTFGHIIGLNLTARVRDVSTYDFYDIAFQGIHKQPKALVGFAHLAWNGCDLPRGFPWYVTTGELDFVELLQFSQVNTIEYYDYLDLGFRLTAAAGSDTPWGSTIGEVRTYVYTGSEFDVDAWFDGLEKGRTFVSNGPVLEFTVDGELPGTEMHKKKGESIRIEVQVESHDAIGVPTSLSLAGTEGTIAKMPNLDGHASLSMELTHRVERSQWLAVHVVCDNGAIAHTTPVYVVVDGQPVWNAERAPGIIQKQLTAIDAIAAEFDPQKDSREQGIHERLDRARQYYRRLLESRGRALEPGSR